MSVKIRLARGGAKKRPYYSIVVANSRDPRDGRFIEKVGSYDPRLPKDSENRVQLDAERIKHWLGHGAQPTDRVLRFLDAADIQNRPARNNPKKAEPGQKAKERAAEKAEAEEAAKAAAEEAKNAPAEEAPVEEAAAEDAPAEDAVAEDAAAT